MTDDQTPTPVDAGLVEIIAHAIEDWVENSVDYDLPRAAAESALSAIVATGGAVLGPETVQAVRRVLHRFDFFENFEEPLSADLDRIAAALPKEGDEHE
jgi:hypothetical protein